MSMGGGVTYNVYLPDKQQSVGGQVTPTAADPQNEGGETAPTVTNTKNDRQGASAALAVNAALSLGKTAVNQVVSNIGIATGNVNAQSRIQEMMSFTTTLIGVAASFSNPVTAAVSIASMAIGAAGKAYAQYKETQEKNYTAEQNARRYGGFYSGTR